MSSYTEDALQEEGLPCLPDTVDKLSYSHDMISFWKASAQWLRTRGIRLYDIRTLDPPWRPYARWFPPAYTGASSLPFALRKLGQADQIGRAICTRYAYAQDTHGHDLFLKLIGNKSVERDVNKYLLELDELVVADKFPCVMPPVAVLDSPHDFSLLVMPLWTDNLVIAQNFGTVRDILRFIECTLTGLSFLHDHRIAHRDISDHNMLVNCYCPDVDEYSMKDVIQQHIREAKSVTYCLFDFSMSVRFPPNTNIHVACRPSHEAFDGTPRYHPSDSWRGKPTYNPFAFDVACLGNVYLHYFSHAIPIVPALAPLFAQMTTWVTNQRCTAKEALEFYHDYLAHLPASTVATEVVVTPDYDSLNEPDTFWHLLPASEQKRWQRLRVPPKPWGHRFLEWIASFEHGWDFLYAIRSTLHM